MKNEAIIVDDMNDLNLSPEEVDSVWDWATKYFPGTVSRENVFHVRVIEEMANGNNNRPDGVFPDTKEGHEQMNGRYR